MASWISDNIEKVLTVLIAAFTGLSALLLYRNWISGRPSVSVKSWSPDGITVFFTARDRRTISDNGIRLYKKEKFRWHEYHASRWIPNWVKGDDIEKMEFGDGKMTGRVIRGDMSETSSTFTEGIYKIVFHLDRGKMHIYFRVAQGEARPLRGLRRLITILSLRPAKKLSRPSIDPS